ncbi:MAG: diaminopimelate decarboxylase [Lachnospiraceae bacterium]
MSYQSEEQRMDWDIQQFEDIVREYGSPVYIYSEAILRERCRDVMNFVKYKKFIVDYSMKANSNPALLKIIREEGLEVDVMSPGEIYIAEAAGYEPEEIFYICNNVSAEEMLYVINKGIRVCVDSLEQLEQYGQLAPHSEVSIRINPGIGIGHHEKVVTAGKKAKFGINVELEKDIRAILEKYDLKLIGITQHIGSLFLDGEEYLKSAGTLIEFSKLFSDLEFVDLGGGFGIPYRAAEGESRLDLCELGKSLDVLFENFVQEYGREIYFRIEPGRYIVAECGMILGTVNGRKYNHESKYIGTDVGFNVLMRPVIYDAYHEVSFYRNGHLIESTNGEEATVVGNICESGDILAGDRMLPDVKSGDIIAVKDAGAYGHVMSSNYNGRLRTGEVLLSPDGSRRAIRKRDSFEDLICNYVF